MTNHVEQCQSESKLPLLVTYVFGSLMALVLIVVIVYSYYKQQQSDQFWRKKWYKKIWAFMKDSYKRKSCFIPIVSHIFDTVTDVAVIIEFYEIADKLKANNSSTICNDLNVFSLFLCSVFAMIMYRLVSCTIIYRLTNGNWLRVISQIFDLELFRAMHINYLLDNTSPCNPQRLLQTLESSFESSPQSLVQLAFLISTNNGNIIVTLSTIFSLYNITSKVISDDKTLFKTDQGDTFNYKSSQGMTVFIVRYIYRIFDIPVHIILLCFVWITIGGYYLFAIILIDLAVIIFGVCKYRDFDILLNIISMPLPTGHGAFLGFWHKNNRKLWPFKFYFYRNIWNIIVITFVTIFVFVDFECPKCHGYDVRDEIIHHPVSIGLFIYCWIGIFLTPILWYYFSVNDVIEGVSKDRDTLSMIRGQDWNGVLELLFFVQKLDKSAICKKLADDDDGGDITLLGVAVRAHKDDISETKVPKIMRDWINKHGNPYIVDNDTLELSKDTAFITAAANDRPVIVALILLATNPNILMEWLTLKNKYGNTFLHYVKNVEIARLIFEALDDHSLKMELMTLQNDTNGYTALHYLCNSDKLEMIEFLLEEAGDDKYKVMSIKSKRDQLTPFMVSCDRGKVSSAKLLFSHYSDDQKKAVLLQTDNKNLTILEMAKRGFFQDKPEMVKCIEGWYKEYNITIQHQSSARMEEEEQESIVTEETHLTQT